MQDLNKKDLIYALRELVVEIRKAWKVLAKSGINLTAQELVGFKEGALIPVLEKITILAGNAILLGKTAELQDALKMFADIYRSAAEVEQFALTGQEHLSWTLPSKYTMEYLYVIGALAVKVRNITALKEILSLQVEYPPTNQYLNHAGKLVFVFRYPFYYHGSGEGNLNVFFDEAKNLMKEKEIFFDWFDREDESLISSIVNFDFFRGFFIYIQEKKHYIYSNFPRFYSTRIYPSIRTLFSNKEYEIIYGKDFKDDLVGFLIDAEKSARNQITSDWWVGDWRNLEEFKDVDFTKYSDWIF